MKRGCSHCALPCGTVVTGREHNVECFDRIVSKKVLLLSPEGRPSNIWSFVVNCIPAITRYVWASRSSTLQFGAFVRHHLGKKPSLRPSNISRTDWLDWLFFNIHRLRLAANEHGFALWKFMLRPTVVPFSLRTVTWLIAVVMSGSSITMLCTKSRVVSQCVLTPQLLDCHCQY